MSNVISLRDASLTTLAVSIRVLQVGQKQMTLAVLKQLEREAIVHVHNGYEFNLRGIPWGIVNYPYDKYPQQLVWQLDEELRRSPCGSEGEADWPIGYTRSFYDEQQHGYLQALKFWRPFHGKLTQLFVAV